MSAQNKKSVLVTGGAGYIGSACVDALVKAGHTVTVFDDLSTGQRDKVHPEANFIQGDITDKEAVRTAVGGAHFDTVIHFAAKKAVGESEQNPSLYFHTNVVGSFNLLSAMAEAHVPQLIFSSTAVVYESLTEGAMLTEDTPTRPSNIYGHTKLIVENMIREYHRVGIIKSYVILRYFNVAGDAGLKYTEHQSHNIFPVLKSAVTQGTSVKIFGTDYTTRDGTCIRDYIHLNDLVDAHLRALLYEKSDVFNLGTGIGYTVRELIAMFEYVSGKRIDTTETIRRAGDPAILITTPNKAKQALGWSPQYTLEDMVRSTLEGGI